MKEIKWLSVIADEGLDTCPKSASISPTELMEGKFSNFSQILFYIKNMK